MPDTHDSNWLSFVGETGVIRTGDWENPSDSSQYDDLFKCSSCIGFGADGLDIAGGSREDSVDCVRGSNYSFRRCIIRGSTTIKGSINGWLFEDNEVHAQIEVGQFDNYWNPGTPPTRGGVIRRTYHPGGKVKVVLWNADVPTIEGSDVQITKVPWVVWFPYFCWRYIYIRLF